MAQITHYNPNAQRKAVEYTGSEVIYEGMPLCYSFKSTLNWHGYSDSAGAVGDTTAEGSLNEGKFIRVEKPLRISLDSDTPADGSKTITGTTTDFNTLQVGMFVTMTGTAITNGTYRITAISRSTESGVTHSTITLDMPDGSGTDADVTTALDNIHAFAGVVAAGGWVGKTGPQIIEIYIPNGAVVPVRAGLDCVTGRTVLAIHTNEDELTTPHRRYAKPVAVAWETYTHSATTPGLVLAKLDPDMFIRQVGDTGSLVIDNEDTTDDVVLNEIKVVTNQTGGQFTALHISAESAAGASTINQRGLALKVEGLVTASVASTVIGTTLALEITGGTVGEYASACQIKLYESGATLSSMAGALSVLNLCAQVGSSPAANSYSWVFFESHGTEDPDFLFKFIAAAEVPMATTSDETVTHKIPIRIASSTYYLCVATIA